MNREGSSSSSKSSGQQRLWAHPLQVPSLSANNAQDNAILSSVQSLDRTRLLKRTRAQAAGDEPEHQHQSPALPSTNSTMEPLNLKPVFQLRQLSLDRGAIAPGLAQPTAPFAKSARKKAYVSAIYYSECFLRKIEPRNADMAAFDIQNQYTKWWVNSKKQSSSSGSKSSSSGSSKSSKRKRRRLQAEALYSEVQNPSRDQTPSPTIESWDPEVVNLIKERMIEHLQKTGGDTTTTEFKRCLEHLQAAFASQKQEATSTPGEQVASTNGTWLTLSKPTYSECQGRNEDGEYLYTLGRMSFDMFRPTHLRCSIRAVMNNIRVMDPNTKPHSFPSRLGKQLQDFRDNSDNPIRHYDIVVAFTIQANQTRQGTQPSEDPNEFVIARPIRGLMTNHGYMVSDPDKPNRTSIWFTGGSVEVQDEIADGEIWKQIFDESFVPRRDPKAMANVLAAKLLLGAHTTIQGEEANAESVPTMSYYFKRPIGGHGEVYCDALYVDETLRITQGHHGSIFVSTRVPIFQEPTSSSSESEPQEE